MSVRLSVYRAHLCLRCLIRLQVGSVGVREPLGVVREALLVCSLTANSVSHPLYLKHFYYTLLQLPRCRKNTHLITAIANTMNYFSLTVVRG